MEEEYERDIRDAEVWREEDDASAGDDASTNYEEIFKMFIPQIKDYIQERDYLSIFLEKYESILEKVDFQNENDFFLSM